LRIPKAFAEQLRIFDGKAADIQVRDGTLVVTPVAAETSYDIDALVALMTAENMHGEIDTGQSVGNELG
jgi:antitoxin MazE